MDAYRAARLGEVFAQVIKVCFNESLVQSLSSSQATSSQFDTLNFISSHPLATVGDLSEGLQISYPSATNMALRLHKKGLVIKRGVRSDRRIVRLTLTPAGEELVRQINAERIKLIEMVLNSMSQRNRTSLLDGMSAFVETAQQMGICSPEKVCLACGTDRIDDCPLHTNGEFECK